MIVDICRMVDEEQKLKRRKGYVKSCNAHKIEERNSMGGM